MLNATVTDICLPSFFSGDSRPHIQVPIYYGMPPKAFRDACHSELNQGCVAGNDPVTRDDAGEDGDRWYKTAHAAINPDIRPSTKGKRRLFLDLDKTEDDDCSESVYAFIVFTEY